MNGVISDITVKGFFKQSMVLFAAIVCLLTPAPAYIPAGAARCRHESRSGRMGL